VKSETIKAIFTNLLFVLGVILLIFGFTQGALTAARIIAFDKYPLPSWEETRCEIEFSRPLYIPEEESVAHMSDEELEMRREKCEQSLEHQRQTKKVDDVVTSVSLLVAGVLLVLTFRRFILK
jgi:hypothetical protein